MPAANTAFRLNSHIMALSRLGRRRRRRMS